MGIKQKTTIGNVRRKQGQKRQSTIQTPAVYGEWIVPDLRITRKRRLIILALSTRHTLRDAGSILQLSFDVFVNARVLCACGHAVYVLVCACCVFVWELQAAWHMRTDQLI